MNDYPASNAVAVTPSDTVNLTDNARGLYVGGGGNVSVRMAGGNGNTVVFVTVPDGSILPVHVRGVNSTGTTATSIVALW